MNLLEAEILAQKLIDQHLKDWSFGWNDRKKSFGLCRYKAKRIELSSFLTPAVSVEEVRHTILHEIAHAIAGPKAKHGPEWQAEARRLGIANPCSFKTLSQEEREHITRSYKWVIVHEGRIVHGYFRKPGKRTFMNVKNMYIKGRPETKGQLTLLPADSFHQAKEDHKLITELLG